MNRLRLLLATLLVVSLGSCDKLDMADQRKARTWDRNSWLANGTVMQRPPIGAVAHGLPGSDVPQPQLATPTMLAHGREQFDIDCAPCHGRSGDGYGMIVERGFPHPPPLYEDKLRRAKARYLYHVITNGHGVMYGYADRVPSSERWAIVAYIRALQASANIAATRLDTHDLAKLSMGAGNP